MFVSYRIIALILFCGTSLKIDNNQAFNASLLLINQDSTKTFVVKGIRRKSIGILNYKSQLSTASTQNFYSLQKRSVKRSESSEKVSKSNHNNSFGKPHQEKNEKNIDSTQLPQIRVGMSELKERSTPEMAKNSFSSTRTVGWVNRSRRSHRQNYFLDSDSSSGANSAVCKLILSNFLVKFCRILH